MRRLLAVWLAAAALAGCSTGGSDGGSTGGSDGAASSAPSAPVPDSVPSLEVREPVVWVCRGDVADDACDTGLDAVAVTADGQAPEPFVPAADPPLDCFYVYPTVSQAPGDSAPKQAEPAVVATVRAQAALFGEVCRVFAPVYRQVTLAALRTGAYFAPGPQQQAYDDVRDAWRSYLNEHNEGRGVVLVGHSQGAMALSRLLADDVLAEPAVRDLVVSALLVGGQVTTDEGSDVADRAGRLPACREPGQTGCVVAYSTFAQQPPADAVFGRTVPGREVLCTDPGRLAGGDGTLTPYLPTDRLGAGLAASVPAPAGAAFAAYPGALTAACRSQGGASWLEVAPVPGAPLPQGALDSAVRLPPGWGLHAVDVSLALGDLVEVVRRQGQTWTAAR